jgi:hypothetical protein
MTSIDNPTYSLRALTFNAITRELTTADRFVSLTEREAMSDSVLAAFAVWLTDVRTLGEIAAALTAHEVESAAATGCEHHQVRDCQEERARLMAVRLALLTGFGS